MSKLTRPAITQISVAPIQLAGEIYDQRSLPKNPNGFAGEDLPLQSISNSAQSGSNTVITVPSPLAFKAGRYAIVIGIDKIAGLYQVVSVDQNTVTLDGFEGSMIGAQVKPINTVIRTEGDGLQLRWRAGYISNLVLDAKTTPYGFIQGGKYETGTEKPSCAIGTARFVGVDGGSRSAFIVASSGSSLGVDNIAIRNCGIGLHAVHGASIVGTGAYIKDAAEDALKCEHSSTMYIGTGNVLRTSAQSALGCRYTSAQEIANFYFKSAKDAFATSQFNSYVSIRNCNFEGQTVNTLNAVDGGIIVLNNLDFRGVNATRLIRATNGAIVRSVGNCQLDGTFSEKNDINHSQVNVNGINLSGNKVHVTLTPGTINANGRYAQQRTLTGYRIDSAEAQPLNMTVLGDLPRGVVPFVLGLGDNLVRVILQNTSNQQVEIPSLNIILSY